MVNSGTLGSNVSVGTSNSKHRPIAIVLMGQPCSGKSTLADKLRRNMLIYTSYIGTDHYIELIADITDSTYDDTFKECFKEADKAKKESIQYAIKNKLDILWDQTNLNFKYQFPKDYYKIAVIMPYVTWTHTQQVNGLRKGKTISYEVWQKFANAYNNFLNEQTLDTHGWEVKGFDETIFAPSFSLNEKKVG